jgi:hypothetical protein
MTSSTEKAASHAMHAGEALVRQVRSAINPSARTPGRPGQPASGWLVVTVLCEPSAIDIAELPTPLAELGDQIEVRVRPAADSKGTELAARLTDGVSSGTAVQRLSGSDPQSDVRSALRRAKQLIEVGEVLAVDPAPHGKRSATPGGLLLETWTKVAPKAGVR